MEHTEQLENNNGTAICKSCLHDSLDGKLEADKVYHNINADGYEKSLKSNLSIYLMILAQIIIRNMPCSM